MCVAKTFSEPLTGLDFLTDPVAGVHGRKDGHASEATQRRASQTSEAGLSSAEAESQLIKHGPNVMPMTPPIGLWRRFLTQFRSPLIYILLFALAVDLTIWLLAGHTGWPVESFAIALLLLLNAGLRVYHEAKPKWPSLD